MKRFLIPFLALALCPPAQADHSSEHIFQCESMSRIELILLRTLDIQSGRSDPELGLQAAKKLDAHRDEMKRDGCWQ